MLFFLFKTKMPQPGLIPKLNLCKSPADDKDYTTQILRVSPRLEASIDNSLYCTSVKQQIFGDCTSMATISLLEYNRKKYYLTEPDQKNFELAGRNDIFSEKFTYYTTRVGMLEWSPSEDSGAYLKDAVASTVRYGACLESKCPYDKSFASRPSTEAYQDALKYQSMCYACVKEGKTLEERKRSLEDCKRLILEKFGLVAGFVCYENIWDEVKGLIPLPVGQVIGGHAIFLCGYDDSREVFKFKNSWGTNWGDGGYGYLPYAYLLAGDMWDIWTVIQQEDNNTVIGVFKPTTEMSYLALKADVLDSNRVISQNISGMRKDISVSNSVLDSLLSVIASAQKNNNLTHIRILLNNAVTHVNMLRTNLKSMPQRLDDIDRKRLTNV